MKSRRNVRAFYTKEVPLKQVVKQKERGNEKVNLLQTICVFASLSCDLESWDACTAVDGRRADRLMMSVTM